MIESSTPPLADLDGYRNVATDRVDSLLWAGPAAYVALLALT
jgi:hypothetical protein